MSSIENDISLITSFLEGTLSADAFADFNLRLVNDLEFNGLFQDFSAANSALTLDELYKIKHSLDSFNYTSSPVTSFVSSPINWIGSISAILGLSSILSFGFITAFDVEKKDKVVDYKKEVETKAILSDVSTIRQEFIKSANSTESLEEAKPTKIADYAYVSFAKGPKELEVTNHELKNIQRPFSSKIAIPCQKPTWKIESETDVNGVGTGAINFKLNGYQKDYYTVILNDKYIETYNNKVRFNNLKAGEYTVLLSLENGCGYEIGPIVVKEKEIVNNEAVAETKITEESTSYLVNSKTETFKLPSKFDSQYIQIFDENKNLISEKNVKAGEAFEWSLKDAKGHKVTNGNYYYHIDYQHASDEEDIKGELIIY